MSKVKSEPAYYRWDVRLEKDKKKNKGNEILLSTSGSVWHKRGGRGVPEAIHRLPFDRGMTLQYYSPPIFNIISYNRIISWLTEILNSKEKEQNSEDISTFFMELKKALDERGWAKFECIYNSIKKDYVIKIISEKIGKRDPYFSAQTIKSIESNSQKYEALNGQIEQVYDPDLPSKSIDRKKSEDFSRSFSKPLKSRKRDPDRDLFSLKSRMEKLEKRYEELSKENKETMKMIDEMRKRVRELDEEYSNKLRQQHVHIDDVRIMQSRVSEYPDNLGRLKDIWEEKFESIILKMRELSNRTK